MKNIKKDFPIFKYHPHLTYLDSAATALKPQIVIDKINDYYQKYSANIFRGVYSLSEKATAEYEETRKIVAQFIGGKTEEIVFTRNATESLNLVAHGLGQQLTGKPGQIVTTIMEHHANFVPWQALARQKGWSLKITDINEDGQLKCLADQITKQTKILAITYVSNVLGTINHITKITQTAKKINPKIIVVVDGAQAVPHLKINVARLGADFVAFSSHKMLGPTGVGVLWGRKKLLEKLPPYQYGGEMIKQVTVKKTTFQSPPHRFEAGTPHIAGVIALKEAIGYLQGIGRDKISRHEQKMAKQTILRLKKEFGDQIKIFGPQPDQPQTGVVSFAFAGYHPHDVAQILDENHLCVRAGHHCAQPLHQRLGIEATIRASFYVYNEEKDIDKLVKNLKKVQRILK